MAGRGLEGEARVLMNHRYQHAAVAAAAAMAV